MFQLVIFLIDFLTQSLNRSLSLASTFFISLIFFNAVSLHSIQLFNTALNENSISYYIPGKSKRWMLYSAKQHENIMRFYSVNLNNKKFKYNNSNQNWLENKKGDKSKTNIKKGDILLILPNSDISQMQILSNLKGINIKKIFSTNSPNYFEIPEIRHFLKFLILKNSPNLLGTKMVSREVDYAIFEVL